MVLNSLVGTKTWQTVYPTPRRKKTEMFRPFQICNVGHYITKEYICRIITFDVENKWKKKDQEESLILAGRFSARDVFLTMAIAPE